MGKKIIKKEKIKKEEKVEVPRAVPKTRVNPKGREETYFFPEQRKVIKASNISEAIKKLNE